MNKIIKWRKSRRWNRKPSDSRRKMAVNWMKLYDLKPMDIKSYNFTNKDTLSFKFLVPIFIRIKYTHIRPHVSQKPPTSISEHPAKRENLQLTSFEQQRHFNITSLISMQTMHSCLQPERASELWTLSNQFSPRPFFSFPTNKKTINLPNYLSTSSSRPLPIPLAYC